MPNPGSFTVPPTAVTGGTVDASYTNIFRDNSNWFDATCPAPGAADRVLFSTSGTTRAWGTVTASRVQDGAINASVLGSGAVSTDKVAALAVTEAKLHSSVAVKLAYSGMVAWVRQVSEVPSGWSRESNLAGRLAVGAGTVFSVTWVAETDYGSSWGHRHDLSATSGTQSALTTDIKNGDNNWPTGPASHTHAFGGKTESDQWTIPLRAAVHIRR